MTKFQEMVQDIVKHHKGELSRAISSYTRMSIISEMNKELQAMKETWEMLNPNEKTSVPSFKELMESM